MKHHEIVSRPKRRQEVDTDVFLDRLKRLMVGKGISPAELADRADIPRSAISQFFTEHRKPSANALVKVANVLDTSVDYLLGRRPSVDLAEIMGNQKFVGLARLFLELQPDDQDRVLDMVRLLKQTSAGGTR